MSNTKETPVLQYTKSHPNAKISPPAKPGDAGYDLHIVEDVEVDEHTKIIDSHISVAIPEGYVGLLFLRSSAGIKKHLRLPNHVGVIDSTYRGTIKFALYFQHSIYSKIESILGWLFPVSMKLDNPKYKNKVKLETDERICQLVIVPYASLPLELVDKLPETERGTGGIGSTG